MRPDAGTVESFGGRLSGFRLVEQPGAGSRLVMAVSVVVVQASMNPTRQVPGEIIVTRGDLAGIAIPVDEESPVAFRSGEPVIIVGDGPEGRAAARASFMGSDKDAFWFQVPGIPWVVEGRRVPKLILSEACEVVGSTLGERVRGTIMDISEGGARISVPEHVGESRLDLKFVEGTDPVSVPSVLLACVKEQDHSELRVRFDKLSRPQELAVRRYVDRWVKERRAS